MQTYWDLSPIDRAALTRDQVDDYIKLELMEKGVIAPKPYTPEPIEDIKLVSVPIYRVSHNGGRYGADHFNCGFTSQEAAQAFINLNPLAIETDYAVPTSDHLISRKPLTLTISFGSIIPADALIPLRSALERNEAVKNRNTKAQSEYDKAVKAAETASRDLWTDYYEQKQLAASHAQTLATYDEYVTLAKGDTVAAFAYLCKALPAPTVSAAFAWFNRQEPRAPDTCEPAIGVKLDVTA